MDAIVREALFNHVRAWMLDAGELIKERIDDTLEIVNKSAIHDFVTEVDKDVEVFFDYKIEASYKEHLLISEEGYGDNLKDTRKTVCIIDPIDGKMNFVNQKQNFAISIGIY